MKKKEAISLIVLVITIIVMIVLAGTVILSLSNSGIIGKAQEAVDKSNRSNIRYVVSMSLGEWELMSEEKKEANGNSFEEYAKNKLKEAGFRESHSSYEFGLRLIDECIEGTAAHEVEVGDYVWYPYTAGEYNTSDTADIGTDAQTFSSVNKADNAYIKTSSWRVLSNKDGVVKLISVGPAGAGNILDTELTLSGKKGYLNAAKVLNALCETLYSGQYGIARSINMDDIAEIYEYDDPTEDKGINQTGYRYLDSNDIPVYPGKKLTIGQIESELGRIPNRSTPDGRKLEDIENDFYFYNFQNKHSSIQEEMVFFGDSTYQFWIANTAQYIDYTDEIVKFCVNFRNGNTYVSGKKLYMSNNEEDTYSCNIYPIVTLNIGVKVQSKEDRGSGHEFNEWTIVEE